MAISLKKGQKLSLVKELGLNKVQARLYWMINQYDTGGDADLDSSVFMLGADGKVPSDNEFLYFNQKKHSSGAVIHNGDNKHGTEDANTPAETIDIDFSKVPANIDKIVIVATIYDEEGKLNFGQVSNAKLDLVNLENNEVVFDFNLEEDFSLETAIVAGEFYRHDDDWKFNPVRKGFNGGLAALCDLYEVDVEK